MVRVCRAGRWRDEGVGLCVASSGSWGEDCRSTSVGSRQLDISLPGWLSINYCMTGVRIRVVSSRRDWAKASSLVFPFVNSTVVWIECLCLDLDYLVFHRNAGDRHSIYLSRPHTPHCPECLQAHVRAACCALRSAGVWVMLVGDVSRVSNACRWCRIG